MWELFYARRKTLNFERENKVGGEVEKMTFGVLGIVTIKLHNVAEEQVSILIDLWWVLMLWTINGLDRWG